MEKKAKYIQIEEDILQQIRSGTFKINDKLPSEHELAKLYDVSRTTIVKALQNLESKNYIYKKRGSGSFVSPHRVTKTFSQSRSFTDDMKSIGETPGSILIDYQLIKASDVPDIQKILKLNDDDWVHYFSRVRLSDGIKVALSYDYVNTTIIPKIDINALNSSLYVFLKHEYGIDPISANYQICSLISDDTINALLDIKDEPLLSVSHSSYLQSGEIFKHNQTLYLGSKFCYKSRFVEENELSLL